MARLVHRLSERHLGIRPSPGASHVERPRAHDVTRLAKARPVRGHHRRRRWPRPRHRPRARSQRLYRLRDRDLGRRGPGSQGGLGRPRQPGGLRHHQRAGREGLGGRRVRGARRCRPRSADQQRRHSHPGAAGSLVARRHSARVRRQRVRRLVGHERIPRRRCPDRALVHRRRSAPGRRAFRCRSTGRPAPRRRRWRSSPRFTGPS